MDKMKTGTMSPPHKKTTLSEREREREREGGGGGERGGRSDEASQSNQTKSTHSIT